MTALRLLARDVISAEQLAEVRRRSSWKGIALIVHAWAMVLGAMALVTWWPNPLTFLLAVAIIGSRQLGFAILMHEGAHGGLAPNEKLNIASIGAGGKALRQRAVFEEVDAAVAVSPE